MFSVFDIFSVGLGPSSSHTVGPMRAAKKFIEQLNREHLRANIQSIEIHLYGSLAQTGDGHGTPSAIALGLMGHAPESVDLNIAQQCQFSLPHRADIEPMGRQSIPFSLTQHMVFHPNTKLPKHANALEFRAYDQSDSKQPILRELYYSIGGGAIVNDRDFDAEDSTSTPTNQPYYFHSGKQLLELCEQQTLSIAELVLANELTLRSSTEIDDGITQRWSAMQTCMQRGLHTQDTLPGSLKVSRRAPHLYQRLCQEEANQTDPLHALEWLNAFAMAINEENAAGGRIVTAPTNGAAGIFPAVLHYFDKFVAPATLPIVCTYFLTATAIGSLYKANASISGAEVGCQGEVGVACSMSAAALTAILGGSPRQVECAAEIGMEHNLGLTCDPVDGLVQVPCIERNAMGAVKAVNAAKLALRGTGHQKVSLDKVIQTMWETGNDMKSKYKETAQGGLAVNVTVC